MAFSEFEPISYAHPQDSQRGRKSPKNGKYSRRSPSASVHPSSHRYPYDTPSVYDSGPASTSNVGVDFVGDYPPQISTHSDTLHSHTQSQSHSHPHSQAPSVPLNTHELATLHTDLSTMDAGRVDHPFFDDPSPQQHASHQSYRQASFPLEPQAQHKLAETLAKLQALLPQPSNPHAPVDSPIVSVPEFEHAIFLVANRFMQDIADLLHRTASDLIQHELNTLGKLDAVADILTETKKSLNHLLVAGNQQQLFAHSLGALETPIDAHPPAFGAADHFGGPPSTGMSHHHHGPYNSIDDIVNGIRPHTSEAAAAIHHLGGLPSTRPPLGSNTSESFFDGPAHLTDSFGQDTYGGNDFYHHGPVPPSFDGSPHRVGQPSAADVYDIHHHLPGASLNSPPPGAGRDFANDSKMSGRGPPLQSLFQSDADKPSASRSQRTGEKPSKRRKTKANDENGNGNANTNVNGLGGVLDTEASARSANQEPSQENGVPTKKKRVVHGPWKEAEGVRLKQLAEESKGKNPKLPPDQVDWDYVVDKFGKSRSRHQILIKAVYLGIRPTTTHQSRLVRQKQYIGREDEITGLTPEKLQQYIADREREGRSKRRGSGLSHDGDGDDSHHYDDDEYDYEDEGQVEGELSTSPVARTDRNADSHRASTGPGSMYGAQQESSIRTAMDHSYLPASSNVRGSSESSV